MHIVGDNERGRTERRALFSEATDGNLKARRIN